MKPSELVGLIDGHVAKLKALEGKTVFVEESLSRNRHMGHDRQCATYTRFIMSVEYVGAVIKTGNLMLVGRFGGHSLDYGMSARHVTSLTVQDGIVIVVEQFENATERRTTLTPQPPHKA